MVKKSDKSFTEYLLKQDAGCRANSKDPQNTSVSVLQHTYAVTSCEPGGLSRYSDTLRTGRSGDAYSCGRAVAEVTGSNLARGTDVCVVQTKWQNAG